MKIFISLIVATYGRVAEPVKLLESFRKIKEKDFEVIIVDQNDHDELKEICRKYQNELAIKYFRIPEKNASKARNLGAKHAAAKWIGFPDDDCVYTLTTLAELKKTIAVHSPQMVSGAVLDFDYQVLSRAYRKSCRLGISNVLGRVPEPALFIEKDVFMELNGFDESFGPGSVNFAGEGMELGLKAVKKGIKMIFNAGLQVLHPNKFSDLLQADYSLVYKYSYASGLSLVKHFSIRPYWYLFKSALLFLPVVLYKPRAGKFRFVKTQITGLYDGIILKKHRLKTT